MATKDHSCLSFKSDNYQFGSSNQNDHQYSNLNLNGNQKCSSILETFHPNKSISTSSNSKKNDYAPSKVSDSKNGGNNFSSKEFDKGNFSNGTNAFCSSEDDECKKQWHKNDVTSSKNSKSNSNSTLSLHITAYQNSIEAQNGQTSSSTVDGNNDGTNLSKRKINKVLKVLKTGFASMDAFEIPRQQTTEKGTNEPEIMGFKASQKLQNPNQPPSSTMDENKIKVNIKTFINEPDGSSSIYDSVSFVLEKQTSLEQLISKALCKIRFSTKDFEIKAFLVMNKNSSQYITVADKYLPQQFDKFQLYLAQKDRHPTKITVNESGKDEQQKLSIGTTKIESIGDLSKFLSSKLDIKDGEIKVQKFDEDFGESITVNPEEKFDPSKTYNIHVTKITQFDVVVEPDLPGASANETDGQNGSNVEIEDSKKKSTLEAVATSTISIPPETHVQQQPNTTPALKAVIVEPPINSSTLESIAVVPNVAVQFTPSASSIIPTLQSIRCVPSFVPVAAESPPLPSIIEEVHALEVALPKTHREKIIEEYEKKIDELLAVPENLANVAKKVYSRELILLIQEIHKNFHIVPCPISEDELTRIGIDRATMPAPKIVIHKTTSNIRDNSNSRGGGGRGVNRGGRGGRGGGDYGNARSSRSNNWERNSGDRITKEGSFPIQVVIEDPSINPQPLQPQFIPSEIPKAVNDDVKKVQEGQIENAKTDVKNLLGKLTAANYKEISTEIIKNCNWNTIPKTIDLFFNAAINGLNGVTIYADLCMAIYKTAPNIVKQGRFRDELFEKCQKSFNDIVLREYQQSQEMDIEKKERIIVIIKFMAHLFRVGLLNYKDIENCIIDLIQNFERNGQELLLEYVITFMKEVKHFILQKKEDTTKLNAYVARVVKCKGYDSNQFELMIANLMEFRDKKCNEKKNEQNVDQLGRRYAPPAIRHPPPTNRPSIEQQQRPLGFTRGAHAASSSNNGSRRFRNSPFPSVDPLSLHPQMSHGRQLINQLGFTRGPPAASSSNIRPQRFGFPVHPQFAQSLNVLNAPIFTPENRFNKHAFKLRFQTLLRPFWNRTINLEQTFKSLIELKNEFNDPILFFEQMFSYGCENFSLNEGRERHTVSTLVAKCYYQDPGFKNAFAPAFKKYCKYLVDNDIEGDLPLLKITFPEFFASILTAERSIPINEFVEGFKEFHASENFMFARTLVEIGRTLLCLNKPDIVGLLRCIFNVFAQGDRHYGSEEMKHIYTLHPIDYVENYKNLKELLGFYY